MIVDMKVPPEAKVVGRRVGPKMSIAWGQPFLAKETAGIHLNVPPPRG
jgi:hypothetical protein